MKKNILGGTAPLFGKRRPKAVVYGFYLLCLLFILRIVKAATGKSLLKNILGAETYAKLSGINDIEASSTDINNILQKEKSLVVEPYHEAYANQLYKILNTDRPIVGLFTDAIGSSNEKKIRDIMTEIFGNHVLDFFYSSDEQYEYAMQKEIATICKAYGVRTLEGREGLFLIRLFSKTAPAITLIEAINEYYRGQKINVKVTNQKNKNSMILTGDLKLWFMNNQFINKNNVNNVKK